MFQSCFKEVSGVCQVHFEGVSKSVKHVSKKFQDCLQDFRVFQRSVKGVARTFQGFATGFWAIRKLQGSFKGVSLSLKGFSRVFQMCFKDVSIGPYS